MIRKKEFVNRQQIISEYLSGEATFKQLGDKYDIPLRTIQSWVRSFRKREAINVSSSGEVQTENVRQLKEQLAEAQLKNELLEEMLKLSKEQTGIDIRKKYGTKQS